jgi:hypothetical protein
VSSLFAFAVLPEQLLNLAQASFDQHPLLLDLVAKIGRARVKILLTQKLLVIRVGSVTLCLLNLVVNSVGD